MKITRFWFKWLSYLVQGPRFYGKGGSAPQAPDPYVTAAATNKYAKDYAGFDAQLNRYTQSDPLGQVSWKNAGTAANPKWTQTTSLSPIQQKIFDTQQGTQLGLSKGAGQAASAANWMLKQPSYVNGEGGNNAAINQIKGLQGQGMYDAASAVKGLQNYAVPGGDLATRSHVEQALLGRLNPSLQQDENALRARLANQGLQYGSEAYRNAMRDQSQRVNDARLAVVGQGGQEMQRSQDMALNRRDQILGEIQARQQAGLTNRDQRLQETGALADAYQQRQGMDTQKQQNVAAGRNQRLQELAAMMQAQQSVAMPSYRGPVAVNAGQGADFGKLMGDKYAGQVANYNADRMNKNNLLTSGMGLGAAGLSMLSDERVKENIVKVGEYPNGLNKYEFSYKGSKTRFIGVIAQEVRESHPWAVVEDSDGMLRVHYGKLGIEMGFA